MSQARFSPRSVIVGLALTALLVIALALVAVAQEPDRSPNKIVATSESDPADPNATSYFLYIAASTFTPFDNTMTYVNGGWGCIYRTGGAWLSEHSVQLPQGAEISQIRLYFYDNSTVDNAAAQLYAFPGTGKIAEVESTGTPGQSWVDSAPFSYRVDNSAEALVARLDYQSSWSENVKICGVRIRYQYTPSIVDLPVILNGTSP